MMTLLEEKFYNCVPNELRNIAEELRKLNEIRKVDRFYASSKTCGHCKHVNEELTLRDRYWVCPNCGAVLDRDLNAAKNILRQGIASSESPRKTKITLCKGR